jgi:hypothetical protein
LIKVTVVYSNEILKKDASWFLTLILLTVSSGIGGITVKRVRIFLVLDTDAVEERNEDCCVFLIQ